MVHSRVDTRVEVNTYLRSGRIENRKCPLRLPTEVREKGVIPVGSDRNTA